MAISQDASTPAVKTQTGTASIVSASFSPPAGSLLVAMCAFGWNATGTTTIALSDSGTHTWTTKASASGATANHGAVAIGYTYLTTAPGAITVTGAFSGWSGSAGGSILEVLVLLGCDSSQTAGGSNSAARAATTDSTISVTTVRRGSWIYGVSDGATNQQNLTANGNSTKDQQYNDTTDNISLVTWYGTSIAGTPGAITVGGTWAAAEDTNVAVMEILAAPDVSPYALSQYGSFH